MAASKETIDKTTYSVCAMQADEQRVRAYIETQGMEIPGFVGYISEIQPPLSTAQEVVVKKLGGFATSGLGIGHTTVLFSVESARNLFPPAHDITELNGKIVGRALNAIFFDDGNDIPY